MVVSVASWFGWSRNRSRVDGPPPSTVHFKYRPIYFSPEVRELLSKIEKDVELGKISISTREQTLENHLYIRAFIAWILINTVEITKPRNGSDSLWVLSKFRNLQILINGHKVTLHVGGGLGLEWIDSRLPNGQFRYLILDHEDLDSEPLKFRPRLLKPIEKIAENWPIRIGIGGDGHKVEIEEHWAATGITHHAYQNGYPINSTVDGYKKVAATTETRIDPQELENNFYLSIHKMAQSIEEVIKKNDLIIEEMNNETN